MSEHSAAWEVVVTDLAAAGHRTSPRTSRRTPDPRTFRSNGDIVFGEVVGMKNTLGGAPQTRGIGKRNYSPVCARDLTSPHQLPRLPSFPSVGTPGWRAGHAPCVLQLALIVWPCSPCCLKEKPKNKNSS